MKRLFFMGTLLFGMSLVVLAKTPVIDAENQEEENEEVSYGYSDALIVLYAYLATEQEVSNDILRNLVLLTLQAPDAPDDAIMQIERLLQAFKSKISLQEKQEEPQDTQPVTVPVVYPPSEPVSFYSLAKRRLRSRSLYTKF